MKGLVSTIFLWLSKGHFPQSTFSKCYQAAALSLKDPLLIQVQRQDILWHSLTFIVQLFSKMSLMFAQSSYLVYPTRFSDCVQNYCRPPWTSMTKIWKMRHWREYEIVPHHSANKRWFFHFHVFPLSHCVTHVCVCFACPCEGGQLLSDWRIRATDSLPGVHTRQSSGDPQHLFLLHQLCRGSVGHIWSRLCLIAPSGD